VEPEPKLHAAPAPTTPDSTMMDLTHSKTLYCAFPLYYGTAHQYDAAPQHGIKNSYSLEIDHSKSLFETSKM
jgi:hypothetical protein